MTESLSNSLIYLRNFDGVEDPRIERHKLYPLNEILFLLVSAVISGCQSWEEIADFGEDQLPWLRGYLPYLNGTPSHDTLSRVMSLINYRAFEQFFINWVNSTQVVWSGMQIAIDGKKLRSSADKSEQQKPAAAGGKSAVHLVEAWCGAVKLCLGQYKTEDKSNEITAIPALLDLLDIKNCAISIDAMGCQKKIAEKIIGHEANYIFGLKANQETLFEAVKERFLSEKEQVGEVFEEPVEEKIKRGRIDQRRCRVLKSQTLPETLTTEWKGIRSIIEIQSERLVLANEAYSFEKRYYISSLEVGPQQFNEMIRAHWGIENNLHWTMDVTFSEDEARKRKGFAAQNFGLIRRIALNLLQKIPDKISTARKMAKCARSDNYKNKVLNFNA